MVRNHQDGYPYINLALLFCWKYTETSIFFGKKKLVNEFQTAMGGVLIGISKKIISILKTWQNMVTKFGQFKNLNWPFSSLQFCTFYFLFENKQNRQSLWKNYLVNEFWTAMGGGLLRISKTNISIFKTWQKMETKFGQFKKLKYPNFVNCPNFVTIFCRVLKMKIICFDIPSNPPPIAVRNSLTNQFFQKNWRFCIYSTTKKLQNWRE